MMALVCAWCHLVMRVGDPKLPVSHGICLNCLAKELAAA